VFAAVVFLAVLTAVAWLAGTNVGARWFLESVSRHTGLHISAKTIEGRMFDHLRLEGVRISVAQVQAELDSIELRLQPFLLLVGTVGVKELTLQGVRIRDNTPENKETPPLAWPQASALAKFFAGRIARLQVDSLTYRHLDEPPWSVTTLTASVVWRSMLLSISDLNAVCPSGRFSGKIAAGFHRPSLQADLTVTTVREVAGMNNFFLQGRFLPGKSPEQITGKVMVWVKGRIKGKEQRLELATDVGMTLWGFNLRELRLSSPGRRGQLTGSGTLALGGEEPLLELQLKAADLDLTPELKLPANISGSLSFTGTTKQYWGHLMVVNRGKGLSAVSISGEYRGDGAGIQLDSFNGSWLDGSVQGSLKLAWIKDVTLSGIIRGRNLNPARIDPDWKGVVNFDLTGNMTRPQFTPLRGAVSGTLLESSLHGQPLTGKWSIIFADNDIDVSQLTLKGKGFDINAAGKLNKQLAFTADVSDLSHLIPESAGALKAGGWVRWHDGHLSGAVTGQGGNIAAYGLRIGTMKFNADAGEGKGYPLRVYATGRKMEYKHFQADTMILEGQGNMLGHTVKAAISSAGSEARLTLSGTYDQGYWRGKISSLSGRDSAGRWNLAAPVALTVAYGKISLAPLIITGTSPERVEIEAELTREPPGGSIRAKWSGLVLSRFNYWLKDVQVKGTSSGNIRLDVLPQEHLALEGGITALGTVTINKQSFAVRQSQLSLDGNEHGLRAAIEVGLADGAVIKGSLSSPKPVGLTLPAEGTLTVEWKGIDLALLSPWLPADASLEGHFAGRGSGKILPGQHLEMSGNAFLSQGKIHWRRKEGEINVDLREASASWGWQGQALRGTVSLTLAEYGDVRGTFQLPIEARIPVSFNPEGEIEAKIACHVREKGVLAAVFPGFVRESHGDLDADLRVAGIWKKPRIEGSLTLTNAGAYLPQAGIHVQDVRLKMQLENDLLRIDSFRVASGPGYIEGQALIRLKEWRITDFQGNINGARFQTVFLPELQVLITPQLTFEGTPEKMVVRGEILLPEFNFTGAQVSSVVAPSPDVIREGRPQTAAKKFPLDLDVRIRLVLGDKVLVKVAGIDAQLGGSLELALSNLDSITSKGEIRVIRGRYRTYGVNLEIVRGRLFYAGDPLNQPTLDILALRTIADVRAGVAVGGTLKSPVTKLYSEPPMPDADILAYIVLGHPLAGSSQQAALLGAAAQALLSANQSATLQDQIKSRLGISTLEIQANPQGTSGLMGYKPVVVTPTGRTPENQLGGVSQTMLVVGKYLTPKLYFSYGRSLFSGGNLFLLRYDIFKHWQVETQTGSESGVDLYYKIEFN
jgi:translocation and assembly module TamB